jgi:hypothetical protein
MSLKLTAARRLPIAVVSALILALAFTSIASALPGRRSVDGNDLQSNVVKSTNLVNGEVKQQDLGAGSVISATVKDESLTGADVQNGTIGSTDITDNSLTGQDVQNASLTGDDVADDSLTGQDVKESTLAGVASNQIRTIVGAGAVGVGGVGSATATCAATERAIGASAAYTIPGFLDGNQVSQLAGLFITGVQPTPATGGTNVRGYTAFARNESTSPRTIQVYVTCQSTQIG